MPGYRRRCAAGSRAPFDHAPLLHGDRLFHIRVYAAKHLVHTWLIELELIRVVLIERGGTEDAGIVDHRMRFAVEIFQVTVDPALTVIDIGENMKFLMTTVSVFWACAAVKPKASPAMSTAIPGTVTATAARRKIVLNMSESCQRGIGNQTSVVSASAALSG